MASLPPYLVPLDPLKVHLFGRFLHTKGPLIWSLFTHNKVHSLVQFGPKMVNLFDSISFEKCPPNWNFSSTEGPPLCFYCGRKDDPYLVPLRLHEVHPYKKVLFFIPFGPKMVKKVRLIG